MDTKNVHFIKPASTFFQLCWGRLPDLALLTQITTKTKYYLGKVNYLAGLYVLANDIMPS